MNPYLVAAINITFPQKPAVCYFLISEDEDEVMMLETFLTNCYVP